MISVYSFVTAVIVYNLALVLVYLLRHKTAFLLRYGTGALLFMTALAFLRLCLPLCWPRAYVVTSEIVLPRIETALEVQPMGVLSGPSVGKLLSGLWILGSCAFAMKYSIQVGRAIHRRRVYLLTDLAPVTQAAKRLGVKYQILVSPQVSTPHTVGFFRPAIYLPALELTEAEWDYILRHELQHIKSRDIWIKLFYGVIESVFWWNPVSHLFMRELDTMLELRCDGNLTSRLDENEKLDYLSTILRVVRQGRPEYSRGPISVSLSGSSRDLKQRFEMVLRFRRAANKAARNALCACILIGFILSFAVTVQPGALPAQAAAAGTGAVLPEDAYILFDADRNIYWLRDGGTWRRRLRADMLTQAPYNALPVTHMYTMQKVQNDGSCATYTVVVGSKKTNTE